MVRRSAASNAFEFSVIAALRAHQLRRGCTQRVPGDHKQTTIAQMEIVAGKIARAPQAVELPAPIAV
jgi:DNA-directed RNA polymerase subunit K/omega